MAGGELGAGGRGAGGGRAVLNPCLSLLSIYLEEWRGAFLALTLGLHFPGRIREVGFTTIEGPQFVSLGAGPF